MNTITHTYLEAQAAALDDARETVLSPMAVHIDDLQDACDVLISGDMHDQYIAREMQRVINQRRRNKPPAAFLGCDAMTWHTALQHLVGLMAFMVFVFVLFGLASQ